MKKSCQEIIDVLNKELSLLKQKIFNLEAQNLSYKSQLNSLNDQLNINKINFSKYFENSCVPCYLWQHSKGDLELIDYNFEAYEITKGKVKDAIGVKASEFYQNEPNILYDLNRVVATKCEFATEMLYQTHLLPEKKLFFVKYTFLDPNLVLVQTEDKTIYKQLEQLFIRVANNSLENSQYSIQQSDINFLNKVTDCILDGILVTDNNKQIIYANKAASRILEVPNQELIDKDYNDFFFDQSKEERFFLPYQFNEEQSKTFKAEVFTKSNKKTLLTVSLISLREMQANSLMSLIIFRESDKTKERLALTSNNILYKESQANSFSEEKGLSARERQILISLSNGCSTKQLAKKFFISESTTRNHINAIFRKLEVHSRVEALAQARAKHLI